MEMTFEERFAEVQQDISKTVYKWAWYYVIIADLNYIFPLLEIKNNSTLSSAARMHFFFA